jgi:hypothetical protein
MSIHESIIGEFDLSNRFRTPPNTLVRLVSRQIFTPSRRTLFRRVYEKPLEPQRQVLIDLALAYRWPVSTVSGFLTS